MKRYRTGWISDIHLGSRGSKAEALLQFLREYEFEKLYVVGDFIDVWALRRGIYWPQSHNDVIQKILRAGRKGTQVIYIPGNHDEFVAGFFGHFGAVEILPRAFHSTADGRGLLVFHGHELDAVVQNVRWLAVSYIGAFESCIAQLARRDHVDGVICGHIHTPAMREIDGVGYFNCGDWVESTSALLEDFAGKIELLTHFQRTFETAAPLPIVEADEIHPAVGTMEAVTKN